MSVSLNEFSWELDLTEELEGIPRSQQKQIKSDIGELLKDEIRKSVLRQTSPVDGSRFKSLSKEYRERKKKLGKGTKANLILQDEMINSVRNKNTNLGVKLEIKPRKQIKKAFNHNTGDTLPERQFLPDEDLGEVFKDSIMRKVERLIPEKKVRRPTLLDKEDFTVKIFRQLRGKPKGAGPIDETKVTIGS